MTAADSPAVIDRTQLIERHLPLARSLARRYMQGGEPFDDLEQTARVGLIKAAERYDAERGGFAAYAVPTILGELRRHFRDRGWALRVPRRIQDHALDVERATTVLSAELQRAPTVIELAGHTGLSVEEVLEAHEAAGAHWTVPLAGGPADDDEEIPDVRIPADSGRPARDGDRDSRGPRRDGPGRDRPRRSSSGDTTRLYIGLGRTAGVRPGDLVGAITGEAGLSGRDIGAIEIAQRFALVEVPAAAADDVMAALRSATIKGRRFAVRPDRGFDR